jgi:streptomycin 6-kinase
MSGNFLDNLPKRFVQNTLGVCGRKGKEWLNDLPQIVEELSANWSLEVEKSFPNLSYNYVAPCVCEGTIEAVLKIGLPEEKPEIYNEARFLRTANGNGAVKLLKSDESRRAILLERLSPGANLKEVCLTDEAKAVEIAVGIMRGLLKEPPPNSPFRRLEDWFNNFFVKAAKTNFPFEFQIKTREFYEELSSASKLKFLIHGDLHHENILSATREPFLAIDPKGIIGDIGYEAAVFLNNHLWWLESASDLREKLNDAVRRFSEAFEIEPKDLRKWAFAQMILSEWWTFEENGENWQTDLALAEIWDV